MTLSAAYQQEVAEGGLKADPAQAQAVERLAVLARALKKYRPGGFSFFRKKAGFSSFWRHTPPGPRGLYIWGDVGRGKSMLMDLFFENAPVKPKQRVHFNAFMTDVHARIHSERQRANAGDPIPPVARALAAEARLLCFDEFQISDVADAMILGRLFEQLFEAGTVIVATSNAPPDRLYEGGLNRQLFLPFIAELKQRLDVLELNGNTDYRLQRLTGLPIYLSPLSSQTDAAMDAAWVRLTDTHFFNGAPAGAFARGKPTTLFVFDRKLPVPQAAHGVARFDFSDLCEKPLAAADYLAIAHQFHTVLLDHIPRLGPANRNEARRFVLLIDTLYDEGVKLVCSAAGQPDELYPEGDGAEAFRRTASRLAEMRSDDYLKRGHGLHRPSQEGAAN